ncbi:hypothetical protein Tco_1142326 [Tanacetum coccineum]
MLSTLSAHSLSPHHSVALFTLILLYSLSTCRSSLSALSRTYSALLTLSLHHNTKRNISTRSTQFACPDTDPYSAITDHSLVQGTAVVSSGVVEESVERLSEETRPHLCANALTGELESAESSNSEFSSFRRLLVCVHEVCVLMGTAGVGCVVSGGLDCSFAQDAVAMNTEEKHCFNIGEVNKRAIIATDINSILDNLKDL